MFFFISSQFVLSFPAFFGQNKDHLTSYLNLFGLFKIQLSVCLSVGNGLCFGSKTAHMKPIRSCWNVRCGSGVDLESQMAIFRKADGGGMWSVLGPMLMISKWLHHLAGDTVRQLHLLIASPVFIPK